MRIVATRPTSSKFQPVFQLVPRGSGAEVFPRTPDWKGRPRKLGYLPRCSSFADIGRNKLITLAEAADRTGISEDVLREDYGRYMHGLISRRFAQRHGLPFKRRKHQLDYPLPARAARRSAAAA